MTGPMSGSDGRTRLLSPVPFTAVMSNDVPHWMLCIQREKEFC